MNVSFPYLTGIGSFKEKYLQIHIFIDIEAHTILQNIMFKICYIIFLVEQVHKEVLQENYQTIVNRLDFSQGHVLDNLLQGEAISESDHEVILKLSPKRKDQNRYIIHRFRRYGTDHFKTFLQSLGEEYPDLMKDLTSTYQEKMDTPDKRKCLYCSIINTVDISDVLDSLFENKLIDDVIIEHRLNCTSLTQATLWRQLFDQLKKSKDRCKEVFVEALATKYKDIAESVESDDFHTLFACHCCKQENHISSGFQTDGSGSFSDVSSLSTTDNRSSPMYFIPDRRNAKPNESHISSVSSSSSLPEAIGIKGNRKIEYSGSISSLEKEEIVDGKSSTKEFENLASKIKDQDIFELGPVFDTLWVEPPNPPASLSLLEKSPTRGDPVNSFSVNSVALPRNTKPEILPKEFFGRKSNSPIGRPRSVSNFSWHQSRIDQRRMGISVQQAEQFMNWISRDNEDRGRDRRSSRFNTT